MLLPCCGSDSFVIGSFEDQGVGPLIYGQENRTNFVFVPNGAGGFVFVLKMKSPRLPSAVILYSTGAQVVQLDDREPFESPIITIKSDYVAQRDNEFTYVARCINGAHSHREVSQVVTLDASSPFGNASIQGDGLYSGPPVFSHFDSRGFLQKEANVYQVSHSEPERIDPSGNRLDLSGIRVEFTNEALYNSMFGRAEVRLLDHLNDYKVGEVVNDGLGGYRKFSGVILRNAPRGQSPYYSMGLSAQYAVDRRNLLMKPLSEKGPLDFVSSSIYLPSGLGKVGEFYRFLVCFYELNLTGDYLYFPVTLSRSHEHFGTCPNGDYCMAIGEGR